jgi:hypothetical protein
MTRGVRRISLLGILLLASLGTARAGTVNGTVKNGTTGNLARGIDLVLIQLQGGMQEVGHSKSDAKGEFTFDHPGLGAQPMLVRAIYHGINFNHAVPPGTSTADVDIYEPSKDSKTINVLLHMVVFQPNGPTLIVAEEYEIENKSQPPVAYYRADGNFDFTLPEKGALQQVAASGPSGMLVVQLPLDKKNSKYSIAFAFRPGASRVRVSYELPYTGNAATVKLPTIYPGGRLLVVAPPTVQITGDGLAPGGQEQGMSLYGREDVPAGTLVSVSVSGTAPPPDAGGGGAEQGQQGRDAQQAGDSGGVTIQQVPGRLDVLKWPLIIGFVCLFALGAVLLKRKPVAVLAGPATEDEEAPAPKPKRVKPAPPVASPVVSAPVAATLAPPAAPAPSNGAASLAEVDAAVGTSLDALKERLFRLELRHQAGTITETEYAQERARAEKVLRDLVRG